MSLLFATKRKSASLAVLFACLSTSCGTKYVISTKPDEAEIFNGRISLGKTPLSVNTRDVDADEAGGVLMRIEKAGYKRVWLWVPKNRQNYEIALNLNPFYLRSQSGANIGSQREVSPVDLNRIVHMLLELQTSLLLGQTVNEDSLNRMLQSNPTLGSLHFLKAVYLLSKNQKGEAVGFLKDAIRYSPKEADFISLYNEVNPPAAGGGNSEAK